AAPEGFGDLQEHHSLYRSFLSGLTSQPSAPEARLQQAQRELARGDRWAAARAAAFSAGIQDWLGMHSRRERYRAAYRAFFRDWDILLAPITLRTAFAHIDMPWPPSETPQEYTVDIDG